MGSVFRKGSEQSGQSTGLSNNMGAWGSRAATPGIQAYDQLGTFLKNGQLPPSLSLTGPLQDIAGQQQTANQQLLDTGARGGQLNSGLMNNVLQGQLGRQSMMSNLQQNLFGQALGGVPVGLGGMGGAAGNLTNLGGQRIAQNNAFQGGLGQLTGKLFSLGKGGGGGGK